MVNTLTTSYYIKEIKALPQVFCYGQSAAEAKEALLARGMDPDQAEVIAKHKEILGNRPHSIVTMESLNPHTLGALIAAYENKVFFCGYWQEINAFDQWGVELGKGLAAAIQDELNPENAVGDHDCSTESLINYYKSVKAQN